MGMVMRAALYARYSTDRQLETSIGDQLRAAHDRAAREGWPIVATHADEGISGSTPVALRHGGKALLADALAGRFDVLILEGLDRLSRELGEAETMVKRLEHRGLAGNFDRGMSAGGRSYGYRTEDTPHGRRLVIDPAEAEEVRGIFAAYADGHSVRVIAHRLNARGGPLVAISATRYGCNIAKDRGATICANRRTVAGELVDRRLLAEVRDQLMSPDALLELQGAVHAQVAALRAEASRSGESVQRRLAAVEGELARLVDAVATIGASQALAERIRASEAERLELVQRLAPPPDLSGLLADVTSRYRRLLLQLEDVLRDEDRERTRAILADLLGQVTVVHEGREVFAELEDPAQRLLLAAAGGSAESLGGVAGGAIRPGDCAGSGWPEGHFSGAPLGQPVGGVLLGDQQIELPAHRLHAALAAFVL